MSVPNPDLDRKLAEFLERAPHAKNDTDGRIDALKDAVQHLATAQQLATQRLEAHAMLDDERFTGVHARLASLEEDIEDTGVHNLESIKEKAKEATREKDQMKNYVLAAAGSISLLMLSGAGAVIWYLITRPH